MTDFGPFTAEAAAQLNITAYVLYTSPSSPLHTEAHIHIHTHTQSTHTHRERDTDTHREKEKEKDRHNT